MLLKALCHENIVGMIDVVVYNSEDGESPDPERIFNGDVMMVLEYCDFDLFGLLNSPQVVSTLKYPFIASVYYFLFTVAIFIEAHRRSHSLLCKTIT